MGSGSDGQFGFAFNNVNFSDRLLRIEITPDGGGGGGGGEVNRKRKREHVENQTHVSDLATCQVESDINNKSYKNDKDEGAGGEDENERHDLGMTTTTTTPSLLRVRELHINSAILAAASPFFLRLISNEKERKQLTLKIDASEEAAVMELLSFMYRNSLSVTETPALLHVLIAAAKFEVASCLDYCSRLLLNMPMTVDSALLILDLPSTLVMAHPVKPLTYAAMHFIASRYKNLSKIIYTVDRVLLDEVMDLPLVGIKAILASNDLVITSEDDAYEMVSRWAKKHYSVLEERQEILASHLARFIRFPHMTCCGLKKILTSDDFTPSFASKLVLGALFSKAESLPRRCLLSSKNYASLNNQLVERAYIYKPINIVEFEVPRRQCVVYLDLTRKECEALYPSSQIRSEYFSFGLGGRCFFLFAQCRVVPPNLVHSFGLFIGMHEKALLCQSVDYEFSARSKPTEDFEVKHRGTFKFEAGKCTGWGNLFYRPWDSFIAKDSRYFINDVLHLRAELSINL